MTQLRGYQVALKQGIYDAWRRGAQCVVGVTATGSGKTVTMASMAAELGGIGRVQAHRAELVGQLSQALAREGVRHNIVAAKPTVKAIAGAHMEEFGRVFYDPRAAWSVASVDTLLRRPDPDAARVNWVFTDECFPAGTSIDGVPIERIQAGDTVRAFDETTGQIVPGRVVRTFRNAAPEVMARIWIGHKSLECTTEHPFWVKSPNRAARWLPASEISLFDSVLLADSMKWAIVRRIDAYRPERGAEVYNFEVEKYHTYIAGGVVVHNCHHVLAENKWGKAVAMYPNAKILGMTATPTRADGKGLGRHHDGLADAMVIGPGLAEQIKLGYLVPYQVAAPTAADLDMSDVHITAGGDFNQQEAARAVKRSRKIVGDAVENYCKLAHGKLAIVFAGDIEHGHTLADAFNAAGVPAAMVTGETDEAERRGIMKRFRARELKVLVNVDLFGEGVDVPAVEVVIMCRLTASFGLYCQMIGRALRLLISPILTAAWETYTPELRRQHIAESEKPFGILIDHVGNVYREFNVGGVKYKGLPEGFDAWTLDRRARRGSNGTGGDPIRMCTGCFKPYERAFDACPYCGTPAPEPAVRGGPQQVDGDLRFLDAETLARLRGAIALIDGPAKIPQNVSPVAQSSAIKAHHERQVQQTHLRAAMAQWAGWHHMDSDSTNHKRFYYRFGVDVLSALSLGAGDAEALREKITNDMERYL